MVTPEGSLGSPVPGDDPPPPDLVANHSPPANSTIANPAAGTTSLDRWLRLARPAAGRPGNGSPAGGAPGCPPLWCGAGVGARGGATASAACPSTGVVRFGSIEGSDAATEPGIRRNVGRTGVAVGITGAPSVERLSAEAMASEARTGTPPRAIQPSPQARVAASASDTARSRPSPMRSSGRRWRAAMQMAAISLGTSGATWISGTGSENA